VRAASIRIPARVTRRAKRSGRIGVSRLPFASEVSSGGSRLRRARAGNPGAGEWRSTLRAIRSGPRDARPARPGARARPPRPRALAGPPRDPGARVGVLGLEDHAVAVGRRLGLARVAEVALHEPVDLAGDPDPRGAGGVAELPVGPSGVDARIELLGRREVV